MTITSAAVAAATTTATSTQFSERDFRQASKAPTAPLNFMTGRCLSRSGSKELEFLFRFMDRISHCDT